MKHLKLKINFMQTSQSLGIHFTTRADKAKDGKEPIYACVTVNRQRAYIALKQNVDPKNGDSGKGAAKGNKEEVRAINNYSEEVRIAIGNSYKKLQLKRKMLSAKAIKDLYLGAEQEGSAVVGALNAISHKQLINFVKAEHINPANYTTIIYEFK